MPRLASKLARTSSRVASPNRRNPKKLISMYTVEHIASEVCTTDRICVESSSSLSIV